MNKKSNINEKNCIWYNDTEVIHFNEENPSKDDDEKNYDFRRRPTMRAAAALSRAKIVAGYKSEESISSNNNEDPKLCNNNRTTETESTSKKNASDDYYDNNDDSSFDDTYEQQVDDDCDDDDYFPGFTAEVNAIRQQQRQHDRNNNNYRRSNRIKKYRHVLFDHTVLQQENVDQNNSFTSEKNHHSTNKISFTAKKEKKNNMVSSAKRRIILENKKKKDKFFQDNNDNDEIDTKKKLIESEEEIGKRGDCLITISSDEPTSPKGRKSAFFFYPNENDKETLSSPYGFAPISFGKSTEIFPLKKAISPQINRNYSSSTGPSLISSQSRHTNENDEIYDRNKNKNCCNKNNSPNLTTAIVSKEGSSSNSSLFGGCIDNNNKKKSNKTFNSSVIGSKILPTSTVVVPSAFSHDTYGLDADIKRALKESLETYSEETKNRQLLLEAEYSLARSEFGTTHNRNKQQQQKICKGETLNDDNEKDYSSLPFMTNHLFDEEALKSAKKATLARMNSSGTYNSTCSYSAASSSNNSSASMTVATTKSFTNGKSTFDTQTKQSFKKRSSPLTMLPPFSQKDFERLWGTALERLGFKSTEEIESGNFLRDANTEFKGGKSRSNRKKRKNAMKEFDVDAKSKKRNTSNSHLGVQTRAMYGRTHFRAMKKIIEMTNLCESDIFLDIGHGIGNACLQTAFTIGCESRGIEVVPQRCMVAKLFTEVLMERLDEVANEERDRRRKIGRLELREGSLADPQHKKFMAQADVVLVNNSHDIFGVRSGDVEGRPTLDAYVSGLFAQLKPGARLVSFSPLLALGRSLSEENDRRRKNGMKESLDASFFTTEKRSLGKDAVSWSYGKEIKVFLYTRVKQSSPQGTAIFLCSNKRCAFGNNNGTAVVDDNTGLLHEECVYCGTRRTVKTRR